MVRVRISQVGLAAGVAALACTVAACGAANTAGPQPSTTTSTAASSTTESPASTSATTTVQQGAPPVAQSGDGGLCKSSDLKLSIGQGDAGAGTVYRPLVFTNVSDHTCTIQGFPGVSYVGGADGHQVGQPAVRVGAKGPAVTLNKGQTASAAIGFVNVQNFDTVTCQPQPVRGLRVYPPQETASLFVDMSTTGCGNDKIPGDQLTVKSIVKGSNAQ
ncbi:DUF4232 domain-containing protein [Amycolatopsis acidiphila]|uniref:DUF4232 domain-containing protein n=1 Tax=Amycolatopsis acidiphila TaxID=715473 RepID=A0A558AMS0_9PSEU|nr:DUF4232 domain-containing protein [Amycolatopsis acidiphila]UIJ60263.1 DUF4232 domain-containing protein [Amycolatopsis acidiphila]